MNLSQDIFYLGLLVLSIPAGWLIKERCEGYKRKQLVSTLCGVFIVLAVSRFHTLHSVLSILVNCVIVKHVSPRYCHIASFVWAFGYILFIRTTEYFGLLEIPTHVNTIQLILTLKLVGIAVEINDSYKLKQKEMFSEDEKEKLTLDIEYQHINPSYTDMISYCYCYIGILTGPYYKYRTFYDWLHQTNTRNIKTLTPVLYRLKWLPLFAFIAFFLSYFFNKAYMLTEEFINKPFLFKLLYFMPIFQIFQARFFAAWYLAECSCIAATLGAYPVVSRPVIGKGPSDYKALKDSEKMAPEGIVYNFQTIHNIEPYNYTFCPTVRASFRHWNMTVQYWMAHIIYKRVPFRQSYLRMAVTMSVSSFWHGIHSGFYLCFVGGMPIFVAEELLASAFMVGKPRRQQQIVDAIRWFIKGRSMEYLFVAFTLLHLEDILYCWKDLYFAGNIWPLALIGIGYYFTPKKDKQRDMNHNNTELKEKPA